MAAQGDIETNIYTVTIFMNQKSGTVDILTRLDGEVVGGPVTVHKFGDPKTFFSRVSVALTENVKDPMMKDVRDFFMEGPEL